MVVLSGGFSWFYLSMVVLAFKLVLANHGRVVLAVRVILADHGSSSCHV